MKNPLGHLDFLEGQMNDGEKLHASPSRVVATNTGVHFSAIETP